MGLIDSHCHLDVAAFDADRAEVFARCRAVGVEGWVVPGIEAAGWAALLALARREPGVYPALGLHPMFMMVHRDEHIVELDGLLQSHPEVIAVGEIGLDYYQPSADRDAQLALFQAQLALARRHHRPVILHVRKAHDDVLAQLRRQQVCGGVVHAFSGSLQQARQYIELGFLLGMGGALSYQRAQRLRAMVAELPLTALALETDAPDMPLAGRRGERNSPEYLPQVLAVLAALRAEPADVIAEQTTLNLARVLRLPVPRE